MKRALVWLALLIAFVACSRRAQPDVGVASGGKPVASSGDPSIGQAQTFDNLTVFPVSSRSQTDIGPLTTLDDALAKGAASVHETGGDRSAHGEGAQVNTLVIENKSATPIYVLAGTIVKGGKQDRQIGDDFIVGAHQKVPVDAYCVEHGRWNNSRDGVATGGQFGVVGMLTDSKVRTAAQYQKNQSEVWSKVAAVNAANRKEAASGTLMASVDAGDIAARRTALARKVNDFLAAQPKDDLVGVAYAVDGKVKAVRWFANRGVFQMFRSTLVQTAAMEAITAQSQTAAAGRPVAPVAPPSASSVSHFVQDVQSGAIKEQRATPALNDNEIRESSAGYGATTLLKASAGAAGAPAKPKPVSTSATSF
jgi:hypothetical protein